MLARQKFVIDSGVHIYALYPSESFILSILGISAKLGPGSQDLQLIGRQAAGPLATEEGPAQCLLPVRRHGCRSPTVIDGPLPDNLRTEP